MGGKIKGSKNNICGIYTEETKQYHIYGCTLDEFHQNKPFCELLSKNRNAINNSFFIVYGNKILSSISNENVSKSKMLDIDELIKRQDAVPFRILKKEHSKHYMWYGERKNMEYKTLNFEEFQEKFDVDFCELCMGINTEWDGQSGDAGSYVGYQECSWLKCKSCGHLSSAE